MTFTDVAIIYLACGAPLSMHYFFSARRQPNHYFAVRIILVALFWPIAAFILIRSLRKPHTGHVSLGSGETDRALDLLRIEIEKLAFSDEAASAVFDFRELFARYTGLNQAATFNFGQDTANELFLLSGHENADLAMRCLGRKASNRLAVHANASREDFIEAIAVLSIGAKKDLYIAASAVADLVGDAKTEEFFCDLLPANRQNDLGPGQSSSLNSAEPIPIAAG